MLSKDPKSTPIDPASVLKDEAINQVKNRVQSKVNETLSTPTQKVAGMASAAASLTQSASASANRVTAHPLIHGGGFTGGQTFAENQALQAAHGALLDALGMDSLESGLVFTCTIGGLPDDTFQVTEFNLTEGLSSLFSLSISAVSALPFIDFQRHLGLASSLTVKRDGVLIRKVNGILAGAVQGNTDGVKTWYHFDIRPEMWVMTLNQDSRIFQHQSVPTILKTLLDEAHVKADCQFYREDLHPERLYTTQKRESAFDFWCRLAFEEGINFWFEEEQLFYSDEHMGMTAGIHLTYNPQADTDISDSTAMTWQYGEYLCVDETIHKDNNFVRPSYPLSHENKIEQGGQHSVFESYGRFQLDDEGRPLTQVRFEQLRNGSKVGQATTNCFALMPGKIFTLSQHPHLPMNDRWQVISVSHHGVQPLADNSGGEGTQLSNSVSFIPGTQEWRPPYRYKPTADGDEVATVVGPPGEEIYVNEYGAVKVHFHWDRRGSADHSASCWVRVAMGWSGNGYGFSAVPRIGTQVLVSYLNGDIDRPMITGCTYDGRNAPPIKFPENKTQTTFRSQTHKGEGFNELRFEDAGGKQEVFLHAQKDMNTRVLHDRTTHVLHDHVEVIENNQQMQVKGARTETIDKDNSETVGQHKKITVGKTLSINVGEVIELRCGASVLRMDNGGHVTINGQEFKFEATGPVQITGKDVDIN
ncbi:type VI secretion system tip protein TssI/VgrG [Proteus mirabilis]|uniref:type VI secretion system Vgr family protein n=2 Tax=Proteus mirabilis TaxID=584 RepID=UPI001BABA409|nr:type VI secretion system tip protein TssI/VgrG [Proteus mirabilis]MDC5894716.1 type VI secretion system tip protein TssI/VgrG [Proteus mirabilis]MDC5915851.1 type VI secretion system tip protein TssI/VgrG [Proteus mirabilis]MDC5926368.1 type VI secretion system tip protein TssI/VgrG [Proteus mirabilis]MDC6011354.1 type VI secretion system tip protein TssI/VgrG [Proteus mirabilis]MDC6021927.1 type VI secretion system tip protein TssI/VgrG [Proteus mirabilis]